MKKQQGNNLAKGKLESKTERLELRRFAPDDAWGFYLLNMVESKKFVENGLAWIQFEILRQSQR